MRINLSQDQLGIPGAGVYNFTFGITTVGAAAAVFTNITTSTSFKVSSGALLGSISGSNVTYPSPVSVTPSVTIARDDDVVYTLYRNGTLISTATGYAPAADTSVLAVGKVYNYTLNASAGQNWTANATIANMLYFNVTRGTLVFSLSVSNVTYPNSISAWVSASNIGAGDVNYTLYRNTTVSMVNASTVNNTVTGEDILLGAGDYLYTLNVNTTGVLQNYSTNVTDVTAIVTVSKGAPTLAIAITPSTSVSSGTTTVATGSGCPSTGAADVTCTLTRDGAAKGNPETVTLSQNAYAYMYSSGAGGNWSATSVSSTLTVSPGGSGSPSTGGTTAAGNTYTLTDEQFTNGYAETLSASDAVRFAVAGTTHSVQVNNVHSDTVDVTVSSSPQTATIAVGETKKFDVNDDTYYDLSVKLNKIVGTTAELVVTSVHEAMPSAAPAGTEEAAETAEETAEETAAAETEAAVEGYPTVGMNPILISVALIVVAGAAVWYFMLRPKARLKK